MKVLKEVEPLRAATQKGSVQTFLEEALHALSLILNAAKIKKVHFLCTKQARFGVAMDPLDLIEKLFREASEERKAQIMKIYMEVLSSKELV